jgi:hypothetical protein
MDLALGSYEKSLEIDENYYLAIFKKGNILRKNNKLR